MNTSDNNKSTQTDSTNNNTRSRRSILAGCAAGISVTVAGCSSSNTGSNDGSDSTSEAATQNSIKTPKGTVKEFFQAKKNLNQRKMNDMIMDEGYYGNVTEDDIESLSDQKMSLDDIALVEKSNGTAIVQTKETYELSGFESTAVWNKTLKKTESGWKIYDEETVIDENAVV